MKVYFDGIISEIEKIYIDNKLNYCVNLKGLRIFDCSISNLVGFLKRIGAEVK